jgi:hypothetical protein
VANISITITLLLALTGFIILNVALGVLWFSNSPPVSFTKNVWNQRAAGYGIAIGLLWLVEICINNLAVPPLPYRDEIDNAFWAVIALSILALAAASAYRSNRILAGIKAGTWGGFASGMVACWTALMMTVFGMRFMLRGPLNIAEWSQRGASTPATSKAAYFAFETFAGAMMHLIILGFVMGALLGVAGGSIGKLARKLS